MPTMKNLFIIANKIFVRLMLYLLFSFIHFPLYFISSLLNFGRLLKYDFNTQKKVIKLFLICIIHLEIINVSYINNF